jgi:hypothetical protein
MTMHGFVDVSYKGTTRGVTEAFEHKYGTCRLEKSENDISAS